MLIPGNGNQPEGNFAGYAINRIVVKFDSSVTANNKSMRQGKTGISILDEAGKRHKVKSLKPQFPGAKKKRYKNREVDLIGWHTIEFEEAIEPLVVVQEYKQMAGIIDAQPVSIYTIYNNPNDPILRCAVAPAQDSGPSGVGHCDRKCRCSSCCS